MRVVVTRPAEDAEPLARRLAGHGIEVMTEPLLAIAVRAGAAPDLAGVQALLATSANGVRAFARLSPERSLPLLAVGPASAEAARAAGFARVETADGDVESLARLACHRLDAARGALLHVAGTHMAGDLGGAVAAAGFDYRRAVLYEAATARRLGAETAAALRAGRIDGVLLYSPRTAATFVALARRARVVRRLARVDAYCLSATVAAAAGALAWRRILVARRPDQDALVEAVLTEATASAAGAGEMG